EWFAGRGLFRPVPGIDGYVERIALGQPDSFTDAMAIADPDAENRAGREGLEYLGFADAFRTHQMHHDHPDHGDEVFSLLRDSGLTPERYVQSFFTAGGAGPLSDPERAGDGWYTVRRIVLWA